MRSEPTRSSHLDRVEPKFRGAPAMLDVNVRRLHPFQTVEEKNGTRNSRCRTRPFRPSHRPYSVSFRQFAISPITPRRNASTQAMKIAPWITVTQAPACAK